MTNPLLQISNLDVTFRNGGRETRAVKGASFTIEKGQTVALVGESGSGKSVSALSTLKLLPPSAEYGVGSSIIYNGEEILSKAEREMRKLRGQDIGVIFQEPMTALNPLHVIEKQIGETLIIHQGLSKAKARDRIIELMELVGLENLKDRLNAYPHQLSGGQRQRVMIAMALANNPDLLIADEPTTALDVTVQAQILELLQDLQSRLGMAMLLISHDLSIVRKMASHVCVMKHGEIVEQNSAQAIFEAPQHDYTKMLLETSLSIGSKTANTTDMKAPTALNAQNLKVYFPKTKGFFGNPTSFVKAVDDVSLSIGQGQTLGVVGESGSGKSTLGFALLRLLKAEGAIEFNGQKLLEISKGDMKALRADMQVVFQDPFGALSPRMSVADIISEGLRVHKPSLNRAGRDAAVIEALESVRLDPDIRHRYPHEFSGGQRQRIAIARAMILKPKFIVLDEPTSALDVSVQSQVIDLLKTLQAEHNLTYLFISHDLRVVRAMSHHILVMKDGKIVEAGPASDIFDNPQEEYTKKLLTAALNLKAA